MRYIAVVLPILALILCLSEGFSRAADNSNVFADSIEALDYSYNELRNAEKTTLECRKKNKQLEMEFLNLLSTEQLELYSKLEKAIFARSLVDIKLYKTKLIETFENEQAIAFDNFFDDAYYCAQIIKNYNSAKNDFESKEKAYLSAVKLLFSDDPEMYNMILLLHNQKYH
jgi:hypothetical protein